MKPVTIADGGNYLYPEELKLPLEMSITLGSPADASCYLVAFWVTESDLSGTLVGILGTLFVSNPNTLTTHILTINSLTSQAIPWGVTYDGSSCYENNFEGFF